MLRLVAFLVLVAALFHAATCQNGENQISGTKRIGSNRSGRVKNVTVVYDRCYNGEAKNVTATVSGEARYSDTFSARIFGIEAWGFRAVVTRTDRQRSDWGQRGVDMEWRASYESPDFQNNPCRNEARCTNSEGGQTCHCSPQYFGKRCENRYIHCYPNPCYEAECVELEKGYKCMCGNGTTGKKCHKVHYDGETTKSFQDSSTNSITATLPFSTCKNIPPSEVQVTVRSNISGEVGAKVLAVFTHGFKVKVWRSNNAGVHPSEERAAIQWRAIYDTLDPPEYPCQNNGTCQNSETGTTCVCPVRTTGEFCEILLSHCASAPCLNGGTCFAENDSFRCECPETWDGDRCQDRPGLTSRFYVGSLRRARPPTYGKSVTIVYGFCPTGIATHVNATVVRSAWYPDTFNYTTTGIYPWGFRGLIERTDRPGEGWGQYLYLYYTVYFETRAYQNSPCVHASGCTNSESTGRICHCEPGYTGEFCQTALQYCYPNPCVAGTCNENANGYNCMCHDGFIGKHCDFMSRTGGSYTVGSQRRVAPYTKTMDIVYPECQSGIATRVETSVAGLRRYSDTFNATVLGIYPWGFRAVVRRTDRPQYGWGQSAVELQWTAYFDPEKAFKQSCMNGATCQNTAEGRTCQCTGDYTGEFCEMRLVHCRSNPCQRGDCVELPDGYECRCPRGWKGKDCSIAGPWVRGSADVGSHRYTSEPGKEVTVTYDQCYTGVASEVVATASGSRSHSDTFEVSILEVAAWGFRAIVRRTDSGETEWGQRDVMMDWTAYFDSYDFRNHSCANGAACTNRQGGQECHCTEQFTGQFCTTPLVFCYPNPCNGGTCTEMESDYRCSCLPRRAGKNCDKGYHVSRSSVAFENTSATSITATILYTTCMAEAPYKVAVAARGNISPVVGISVMETFSWGYKVKVWRKGDGAYPLYETVTFEAESFFNSVNFTSNPCQNGAMCENVVNGSVCNCRIRTTGRYCETRLTHCASSPCMHGGVCTPTTSYFRCRCLEPYTGDRCHVEPAISAMVHIQRSPTVTAPLFGKNVTIAYDRCYTGTASIVKATVAGSTAYPDTFNFTTTEIHPWGFRGYIQRTDRPGEGWGQTIYLRYRALFETRAYLRDPCVYSNGCTNSAQTGRKCHCRPGFKGEFCENTMVYCYPNPCNGGTCTEYDNGYRCTCTDDRVGKNCETVIRVSGRKNIGALTRVPPYYKTRDVAYSRCMQSLATNISVSARGSSLYGDTFNATVTEILPWGFRARVQRTDLRRSGWGQTRVRLYWTAYFDPVKSLDECLNGGTCYNQASGRTCGCRDGFTGSRCETRM